ncbi:MAG: hypothetical protein DRO10_02955 [Thermoprotei archaeon]|nr:MAG: hypothetical protein DRO10_02955 [Thermoprotei archaeon]
MRIGLKHVSGKKADGCGELYVSPEPLSYLGDIDPVEGILKGKINVRGRILAYPNAIGSTVGSYVLYGLSRNGVAPKAILLVKIDPMTLIGSIISGIPLYLLRNSKDFGRLSEYSGRIVCIEAEEIVIE